MPARPGRPLDQISIVKIPIGSWMANPIRLLQREREFPLPALRRVLDALDRADAPRPDEAA